MLFHVTHRHGYATCMAHDGKAKTYFSQTISNAGESGVKVHGVYADPPLVTKFLWWLKLIQWNSWLNF